MDQNNQINEIIKEYLELQYDIINNKITGELVVRNIVNDEIIKGNYIIEIDLSSQPPIVREIDEKINNYSHKYNNGTLCLSTDLEQHLYIIENGLYAWFKKYVVSYFLSYEYYKKYGIYPYGEYNHGLKGELESLSIIFNVDEIHIIDMIDYILYKKYRGHDLCPCGSYKKLRNCHKDVVIKYKSNVYIELLEKEKNYLWRLINDIKEKEKRKNLFKTK